MIIVLSSPFQPYSGGQLLNDFEADAKLSVSDLVTNHSISSPFAISTLTNQIQATGAVGEQRSIVLDRIAAAVKDLARVLARAGSQFRLDNSSWAVAVREHLDLRYSAQGILDSHVL